MNKAISDLVGNEKTAICANLQALENVNRMFDKWNKDIENILRDKWSVEHQAETETKKQYIQGSLF